MSLFGKILEKLGFNRPDVQAAPVPPQGPDVPVGPMPPPGYRPPAPSVAPKAISMVDVMGKLDALSATSAQKLNWKVSIVDLMKLLGLDSSLAARKELAAELGCPPEKMGDSAQMNMWLHKTVLHKLAENGGNIPKDLLD
jgi:hypothetical protein